MGWCLGDGFVFARHLAVDDRRILRIQGFGYLQATGRSQDRSLARRMGHHVRRYRSGRDRRRHTERSAVDLLRLGLRLLPEDLDEEGVHKLDESFWLGVMHTVGDIIPLHVATVR